MGETLRIRRLVCRGLNELNPKVWEVWGTARDCPSIDVRFSLPSVIADGFGASKIITAIPRPPSAEGSWCDCDPGEDIWVARFYYDQNPALSPLRTWVRDGPDRVIAIEATAPSLESWRTLEKMNKGEGAPANEAQRPAAPPVLATASTSFRDSDIVPAYEFEAGVLLVHGIGLHPQGDTLIRFADPLVKFLQQWVRPCAAAWSTMYTADEASAWRDRLYSSTMRHHQDLFDLTDEVDRFGKQAAQPGPKRDRATAAAEVKARFLVADVCPIDTILRPLASDPQISGTSLLRLSTAGVDGALDQRHLMLSEAWWTNEVASPSTGQLREWIFAALPLAMSIYFATAGRAMARLRAAAGPRPPLRIRAAQLQDGLSAVFLRGPLALLLCATMQFLLLVLGALLLIPVPWLRTLLRPVIGLLMGTTGQSFAVVTSDLRRSAIVDKVSKQLDWLCERCERVVVLAHSQGAEVSRWAIGDATRPQVQRFIAFGSGIKVLGMLTNGERPRRHAICAALALVLCVLCAGAILVGVPAREWLLPAYAWLVFTGLMFLDPPPYNVTLRKSVPMTDYYASRDPVPCGPLSEDTQKLASINFEEIEVHNRASVLFDHTSYFENIEEFVAPVALALAREAGMDWSDLITGDPQRLEEARTRRRALVSSRQWIGRWTMLGLIVAAAATWVAHPLSLDAAIDVAKAAWNGPSLIEWKSAVHGLPALVLAALPLFVVAAWSWMERILLHRRFTVSARELIERRPDDEKPIAIAVRVPVYAAGLAAIAWWLDHVDFVATASRMLRGVSG